MVYRVDGFGGVLERYDNEGNSLPGSEVTAICHTDRGPLMLVMTGAVLLRLNEMVDPWARALAAEGGDRAVQGT